MAGAGRCALRRRRGAQRAAGRGRDRYRHRRAAAAGRERQQRLEAAGIKAVPTGFDHGTVTAIMNGKVFEVTSLRRDVATDGRHAVVAYTTEWDEDAARRDFTINALYAAADGEIFDYHGGVEDLIAGRVRFVGDAARPHRARIICASCACSAFMPGTARARWMRDALRAAAEAKAGLAQLSGERIAKELLRLLECPNPVPVLRVMAASGILPELLPFALQLPRLEQLVQIDADNFFPPDAILRLAALLPDDATAARAVAERLKLSSADRARLEDLAGARRQDRCRICRRAEVRKLLYRIGAAAFTRPGAAGLGRQPRRAPTRIAWRMLLSVADGWEKAALSAHRPRGDGGGRAGRPARWARSWPRSKIGGSTGFSRR